MSLRKADLPETIRSRDDGRVLGKRHDEGLECSEILVTQVKTRPHLGKGLNFDEPKPILGSKGRGMGQGAMFLNVIFYLNEGPDVVPSRLSIEHAPHC